MVDDISRLLSAIEDQTSRSSQSQSPRITLSDALALAVPHGITVTIRCGVLLSTRELRVGLTTTDNDPMLTVNDDSGESERWLVEREQSGADRWDYPASFLQRSDRYFLRLTMADRFEDVELEAATVAVISEHGWTDDVSLNGEALVERAALAAAFQVFGINVNA